ncbi:hypothetical protein [Carboxylicivirga caseinilyticus]|uniref:hypothetical protein n=1 Tax=Carboxylicivirga caseinilyticus TaxID=3417572 RepID=UPI003D343041|nr:hypothetical protein [Marinilabiliaceae bacterium A049]
MIRVLIDELGDGQKDIILKIDAMPTFIQIGDLYYIADFLEFDPKNIDKVPDKLGIEYIKYVQDKFDKLDNLEMFIPFDLSDQYIGGLLIIRGKKGLIKTTYVTTDKVCGYEINKKTIDQIINDRKPNFEKKGDWFLSRTSIMEGLNWSIERIKKTAANPLE